MEKILKVFTSHEDAEADDRDYYASLTPQGRLNILLEMVRKHREGFGEAGERLERVLSITHLKEG